MDAALLAIWVLRLIFLALLYAFLYFVVKALVRDLRSAAREPTTELGRLVVVASPSGEPEAGSAFAASSCWPPIERATARGTRPSSQPRWRSCTPIPWSMTTCRAWTMTTCAAAG